MCFEGYQCPATSNPNSKNTMKKTLNSESRCASANHKPLNFAQSQLAMRIADPWHLAFFGLSWIQQCKESGRQIEREGSSVINCNGRRACINTHTSQSIKSPLVATLHTARRPHTSLHQDLPPHKKGKTGSEIPFLFFRVCFTFLRHYACISVSFFKLCHCSQLFKAWVSLCVYGWN